MLEPCSSERRRLVDAYTAATECYANVIEDRRILAGCITREESARLYRAAQQAHQACHEAWLLLDAHITGHDCGRIPPG
jgi:hypothetical protein